MSTLKELRILPKGEKILIGHIYDPNTIYVVHVGEKQYDLFISDNNGIVKQLTDNLARYERLEDAYKEPLSNRYIGKEVLVYTENKYSKYAWLTGVEDHDLKKIESVSGADDFIPTVELKIEKDINYEGKDHKIFAKVSYPTELPADMEPQLWIYRLTRTRSNSKLSWSHPNEYREPGSDLYNSSEYQTTPDETRRTEFPIPYFNEWFEVEDFNHFSWFYVNRKDYETMGSDGEPLFENIGDYEYGGTNIENDNPRYEYTVNVKGRRGKTQPLRFGVVFKTTDENHDPKFIKGPLGPMIRLGLLNKKDVIYGDNYVPMGNHEAYKRKLK